MCDVYAELSDVRYLPRPRLEQNKPPAMSPEPPAIASDMMSSFGTKGQSTVAYTQQAIALKRQTGKTLSAC